MDPRDHRFDAVDYVIFVLLLVFSAAIGLFYGFIDKFRKKRQNTTETTNSEPKSSTKEYLLANKSMGVNCVQNFHIQYIFKYEFRFFLLQ